MNELKPQPQKALILPASMYSGEMIRVVHDHHVMPKRNKVFVKTSVLLSFGVPPLGLIEFRLQPHPAGLKPFGESGKLTPPGTSI